MFLLKSCKPLIIVTDIFGFVVFLAASGYAQVNELTAGYGNDRTNANLKETALTPATVTLGNFGKLGTLPVDGQVYAHPLYVSGLALSGQGTHNIVFILTMHNSVYAYDADALSPPDLLWHVNLGPSVPSDSFQTGYPDIAPEAGILSTGTIDLQRQVLYVVSATLTSGGAEGDSIVYQLHALDLANGAEDLNGPVVIQATVPGTGDGSTLFGSLAFDPQMHLQRPGLLLANGAVYVAFGSHADDPPWHGWLMSYNASDLSQQLSAQAITPNSYGGSIWQAGGGLAADDNGNIYLLTGNGFFDGNTEFSNSFLKFTGAGATLAAWFAPPNWQMLADNDYDLVAGPAIIPGTHLLVGGDKYGELYLVDGDSLGTDPTGADGSAQIIQGTQYGGIFTLALWNRTDGTYIYLQEQDFGLRCYEVSGGSLNPAPVWVTAPTGQDVPFDGLAISANGGQPGTGILWETTVDSSHATLHAFDASNLANELWNSNLSGGPDALDSFAKFAVPTVVNGKVYVPTWSNVVDVYGLTSDPPPSNPSPVVAAVMNGASYGTATVSPGEVVTIFGTNLGPADPAGMQLDGAGFSTMLLAGTQVLFDGAPVPVAYSSAGQVSAVAPFGLQAATTQIQVEYQGQISQPFSAPVSPAVPGVFSLNGSGTGQALAFNEDGSLNSPRNPAGPGSVIRVYATGLGQMSPAGQDGLVVTGPAVPTPVLPVTVQLGGEATPFTYPSRAPGLLEEVVELDIAVPQQPQLSGEVPVVVETGGQNSQPGITVMIRPPDVPSPASQAGHARPLR
jgi:uncharacterized protein (TIGR03437 family)